MVFGFSTGALAKGDVASGALAVARMELKAIELSALRVHEMDALVEAAATVDLTSFTYVSVHAPTNYTADEESAVAQRLWRLSTERGWYVIVHPDCIIDRSVWKLFGKRLCIENMDKRKPVGRTAPELRDLFVEFPDATLCFDIAHAQQVDPSMTEAYRILREFGERITQLHVSEVTSSSKHDRMSESAVRAFQEVVDLIPVDVPVILESPVTPDEAIEELRQAARIFELDRVPSASR